MNQFDQTGDPPRQGLAASRARSLSWGQGGHPWCCGILSCVPGTHPLNARGLLRRSCDNQNCPQMLPSVPCGDRVVHGGHALVLALGEGSHRGHHRVEQEVGIVEGKESVLAPRTGSEAVHFYRSECDIPGAPGDLNLGVWDTFHGVCSLPMGETFSLHMTFFLFATPCDLRDLSSLGCCVVLSCFHCV